jgi:REP element-mobilizing transposase RayT
LSRGSRRRAGKRRASRLQQFIDTHIMPQYPGALVPGGTFFFAVTLLERRWKLLTELDDLRAGFRAASQRRPFTVEAIVILPGHLHCIWTLPFGDADFPSRWHDNEAVFITLNRLRMMTFGSGDGMLQKAGCALLSRPTALISCWIIYATCFAKDLLPVVTGFGRIRSKDRRPGPKPPTP